MPLYTFLQNFLNVLVTKAKLDNIHNKTHKLSTIYNQ
jgi:hypothetical protein